MVLICGNTYSEVHIDGVPTGCSVFRAEPGNDVHIFNCMGAERDAYSEMRAWYVDEMDCLVPLPEPMITEVVFYMTGIFAVYLISKLLR